MRRLAGGPKRNEACGEEEDENPVIPTPPSPVIVSARCTGGCRVTPAVSGGMERLLPNGDLYTGSFSGGVPHGTGRYLWKDGCMYEGEWRRGRAGGKGRFSWPSGATYEGDFKDGRMEGSGTFIGSDRGTYTGAWAAGRKHGFGRKSYVNGDIYEGIWRRNVPEGRGLYVWYNGNEYEGEWKNGVISGRGIWISANGNRYDGQWENGIPKGNGIFTWPDGSCYVGNWSKDPDCQLRGTFYPALANWKDFDLNLNLNLSLNHQKTSTLFSPRKPSLVDGAARESIVEQNFPRICIWESEGEAGDITCDIIDIVDAAMFYREGTGFDWSGSTPQRLQSPCSFNGETKKPGQSISKGHKNYNLMLSLQLGISYSVGKQTAFAQMPNLRRADFDPTEKFWTRFPPEGSKVTPPHQSADFWWKDYCPMVFRHLRKLFVVDPADYMLAICGNDALRELSSPGKSGSFFYLTQDDRFMIKTVKKSEVKVLLRMLPSYYKHVTRYENTLITKFFGVHCIKPVGCQKVRFIVIGNLFRSEHQINRRFDLKGSSHGRTAYKAEWEIDETTTLKDLDLNFVFRLQRGWYEDLMRQIERDCKFLEAEGIMDYSLLVGVHFCDGLSAEKMGMSPCVASSGRRGSSKDGQRLSGGCSLGAAGQANGPVTSGRNPLIRLGANMPAMAEKVMRRSDYNQYQQYQSSGYKSMPSHGHHEFEVIVYFGIIDLLQDYDISKKLEHAYKSLQADPTSISAVDPKLYSKRFRDFISKVFVEDD